MPKSLITWFMAAVFVATVGRGAWLFYEGYGGVNWSFVMTVVPFTMWTGISCVLINAWLHKR